MAGVRDEIADSLILEFRRTFPGLRGDREYQLVRELAAWRNLKPSVAELEAGGTSPAGRRDSLRSAVISSSWRRSSLRFARCLIG